MLHKGSSGCCIWWVDDCFGLTGVGALPLNQLGEWDSSAGQFCPGSLDHAFSEDPDSLPEHGDVYMRLHNIAVTEDCDFFICSFEYADANWASIARKNCLILLDVNHAGTGNDIHGLELWFRKTNGTQTEAALCFFSANEDRAADFCLKKRLFQQPTIASKSKALEPLVDGGSIVQGLLSTLKNQLPRDVTKLDTREWNSLTDSIRAAAIEFALSYPEFGHKNEEWLHHLPGGGAPPSDGKIKVFDNEGMTALEKASLHPSSHQTLRLPRYYWTGTPKWKYPPVRALAQRFLGQSKGRDLSRFFHHLHEDAARLMGHKATISVCYPCDAFQHDYLWFNAPAWGEGFMRLMKGFHDEATTCRSRSAQVMLSIDEDLEKSSLVIYLRQVLRIECEENGEKFAEFNREIRLSGGGRKSKASGVFVAKDQAKGIVLEAYEFFDTAGALVEPCGITEHYDWLMRIPADVDELGFWQIKTTQSP